MSLLQRWQELEAFCSGCGEQCDQKCVIDNHEVEIVQGELQKQPLADHCCQSFRTSSLSSTSSNASANRLLGRPSTGGKRRLGMFCTALMRLEESYLKYGWILLT
eukprot:symbB.v1.2.000213.t1/scaffold21.1/size436794/32